MEEKENDGRTPASRGLSLSAEEASEFITKSVGGSFPMGEQYILQWHYHQATLCKNLPFLFDSDILTDCSIAAGNKTFKAHKLILATCSPYFLQLFQNTGSVELPVLILHDSKAEDVEAILSYIYRGQCLVTNDQLPGLISLAKTLKIQGLCSMKINEATANDGSESFLSRSEELIYNSGGTSKCAENYENKDEEQIKQEPFSNVTDLQKKKSVKDTQEICKCFVCGKYLSNQYNLRVHMETHKHTYYSCLSCPHVSKSRDALRKHISYRHPEHYTSRKRKKHDSTFCN